MHKTLIKILSVTSLAVGMLVCTASANTIKGNINFFGGVTLDNTDLSLATKVNTFNSAFVSSSTQDFAANGAVFLTPVTFTTPWTFVSGAHPLLWSVAGFTFDLTSSSIISQSSTFLNVSGTGTIKHLGFDDTIGVWTFTIPSAGDNGTFAFAAATQANLPDGGTTALLVGLGLLGMGLVARRGKRA